MVNSSSVSFKDFIRIDRRKKEAIYLQIVYQFINAVQRNILAIGENIPGTRIISKELKVHRKTVIAAFDELEAQGWVEIRPNVGTFVQNPQKTKENNLKSWKHGEKAGFTFHQSFVLNTPFEESKLRLKFTDGQPDYRLNNIRELSRFYTASFKRKQVAQQLSEFTIRANPFFKEQLCYYLNLTRGFHISSPHISIGKSKELLLYILSQLLFKKDETVLVASFGYFFSNMIFRQAGAKVDTIPVDEQGIDTEYIRKHYQKGQIRCVYVNANNHYPSTISFSKKRREELLALAQEYDFVIIEDDNDFDFQYSSTTTLPMASRENNQQTIYLGNFGKFLIPTFQTTFMIGPTDLITEAEKYLGFMDAQGDIVKEQALGEMIKEGDIHRYLWKSLQVYEKRKADFGSLLCQYFGNEITYRTPTGGLAYWILFKNALSLNRLTKECAKRELFIPRICMYQNANITALRLGFAHFNEDEMKEALQILKEAYNELV